MPASSAPSWRRPWPGPRSKASRKRRARPASSDGAPSSSAKTRWPCGLSDRVRETESIGGEFISLAACEGGAVARVSVHAGAPLDRASLRVDPDVTEVYYELAYALAQIPGRLSEAIAKCQQMVRISPSDEPGRQLIASLLAFRDGPRTVKGLLKHFTLERGRVILAVKPTIKSKEARRGISTDRFCSFVFLEYSARGSSAIADTSESNHDNSHHARSAAPTQAGRVYHVRARTF